MYFIPFKTQSLNLSLKPKENALEEVFIESKKSIEVKGDTINYKVLGLKKAKDYTIGEVIDRIPGVKIGETGQITYNNKPISHLYKRCRFIRRSL